MDANAWFPVSYDESRQRFRDSLPGLQARWPRARLEQHVLQEHPDVSIDWLWAEPGQRQNLVLISTAEHGIEGYVGAAVMKIFIEELAPRLDPETTGLLLVHAINPWGMQHFRRTNAANVDLNRNFGWDSSAYDPAVNPDYARLNALLNPAGPTGGILGQQAAFLANLTRSLAGLGASRFQHTILLGQHQFPRGIYYGGRAVQEESRLMLQHFNTALVQYPQLLVLDMHTGYGPREQLSLVNSVREPRSSAELKSAFGYPHIFRADLTEFYKIQGDMLDALYALAQREAPHTRLFATSFEFGTFGTGRAALMRGLQAMILENQQYWYGARDEHRAAALRREFLEMFYPQDAAWQARALENARAALRGILGAEGYLAD